MMADAGRIVSAGILAECQRKGNTGMIKNVIFDVGNVLVEWNSDRAFRRLGFDEKTRNAVAEATIRSVDWNEVDRSQLCDEELLVRFIARAPEYEKEIRLFWERIELTIRQCDYSVDWIRRLRENGYRVYILSNYARWTYGKTAEELSFLRDVDGALFSFEVCQIKPEPQIYQTLCERYGLVPQECVFLDDTMINIEAARALGMQGILFTGYEDAVERLRECGVACISSDKQAFM